MGEVFSPDSDTVRTFFTMLLTGLILACPWLCRVAEVAQGPHQHQGSPPTESPAHCPDDGDNCICRGAVESADVRVPTSDVIEPLPLHAPIGDLAHSPARSLAHLTPDGSPTGLAGWGDSIAVRALLQNFRC